MLVVATSFARVLVETFTKFASGPHSLLFILLAHTRARRGSESKGRE